MSDTHGPGVMDVHAVTNWRDTRIADLQDQLRASDLDRIRLRDGLRSALEMLGYVTSSDDGFDDKIAELRKLLGGEP